MHLIRKIGVAVIFMQVLGINLTFANEEVDHTAHTMSHNNAHVTPMPAFTLTAISRSPLKEGTPAHVTLFLKENAKQKPVTEDQLEKIHTKKVHALIIDPTLTDYHHAHPKPGSKPGEFTFTFTPATPNAYRIWLDITPVNGEQQYIMVDLAGKNLKNPPIEKILSTQSQVGDYHFTLSFNKKQLKAGEAVIGSVEVKDKNGKPVTQLEPIMEAFAHIVAFNQDYRTILHVHPMGEEPKEADARGGPRVDFHITPSASGYVKLFAQVQIDGKEIIAPFGVNVE